MAVLIEGYSVIVQPQEIEAKWPGGWKQFKSDEQHRKAMRGIILEISAKLLQNCYILTDEQAMRAQQLRDIEGMSEDDAIKTTSAK